MTFKEASDRLTASVRLADIAAESGVALNSILRARMEGPNARQPPVNWRSVIATLARERGGELLKLADEMEGKAGG